MRASRPAVTVPPPAPDPEAPLPYPPPQLSAARLLAQSRADAWSPLPPFTSDDAHERMTALLARFSQRAELHRRATTQQRARQMPPLQGQNWRDFLQELDELMLRVPAETFDNELLRAKTTLETELVADAQLYSEIPPSIVEQVLQRETKFGLRAHHFARARRRESRPDVDTRPAPPLAFEPSDFVWPVEPVHVTSLFGRRFHPILKVYKPHQGLDLQAAMRQEVNAVAAGRVIRAGWNGSHGNHIQIEHPNGTVTGYSHLSKILVTVGSTVTQGTRIGLAGRTGGATGPHLHFEVWRNGEPEDPLTFLGEPPDALRVDAKVGATP